MQSESEELTNQVYGYLLKSFSNIWEVKYGNIGLVAGLVYDLQRYHPDFGVAVIDQVMEEIQIGMEVRTFHPQVGRTRLMTRKTFSNSIRDVWLA